MVRHVIEARRARNDLQTFFKDVASELVQTAMAPGKIRHLIDRAQSMKEMFDSFRK